MPTTWGKVGAKGVSDLIAVRWSGLRLSIDLGETGDSGPRRTLMEITLGTNMACFAGCGLVVEVIGLVWFDRGVGMSNPRLES